MKNESGKEGEYKEAFTAKYLPAMFQAFEGGFEGLGLKTISRSSGTDEAGRSVITFVLAGTGFKGSVVLRGVADDLLAVNGMASPLRIDIGLEDEEYAEEKIAGIVGPLVDLLSSMLGWLKPEAGRSSIKILGGMLEVSLIEEEKPSGRK